MIDFYFGQKGNYFWCETHELNLREFIEKYPRLFLGKFLIITCFDGSKYIPSEEELKLGWRNIGSYTYTEVISENTLQKRLSDNYDQWILLNEKKLIDPLIPFVNYTYFSIIDWESEFTHLECDEKEYINKYKLERKILVDQFWEQLESLNPEAFVSDGSKLIYVTSNIHEINTIKNSC